MKKTYFLSLMMDWATVQRAWLAMRHLKTGSKTELGRDVAPLYWRLDLVQVHGATRSQMAGSIAAATAVSGHLPSMSLTPLELGSEIQLVSPSGDLRWLLTGGAEQAASVRAMLIPELQRFSVRQDADHPDDANDFPHYVVIAHRVQSWRVVGNLDVPFYWSPSALALIECQTHKKGRKTYSKIKEWSFQSTAATGT